MKQKIAGLLFSFLLAWQWSGSETAIGHIWREGPKGTWSKIANVQLSAETYTDDATIFKVGDVYSYKVCAGADQTDCSNVASATAKDK
jgi:hypothetical protein